MNEQRFTIPAFTGYQPEGDPFTMGAEAAPEEIVERKAALRTALWKQMEKKVQDATDARKEEVERTREAAVAEREKAEKEAKEKIAKEREMQIRQKKAYEEQIEERKLRREEESRVVGYEETPEGDRFTKGESAAEQRQRVLASQRRMAEVYRQQLKELEQKKADERAAEMKETMEVIAADTRELEMDKEKERERAEYNMMYGQMMREQAMEQTARRKMESDHLAPMTRQHRFGEDGTLGSPLIGEAPDQIDCEQPYYRKRAITKKERLVYGF
jgi:hypothetical protein